MTETRTMAACRDCSIATGTACAVPFTTLVDRERWITRHVEETHHEVRVVDRWLWPAAALTEAFEDIA